MTGTGVGAVIKRLCYLARVLGVYYDLSYDAEATTTAPRLHLTLYGPQEVTGTPQQYGLRLARLCRMLLGYSIPKTEIGRKKGKRAGLTSAIVEAEATVHFLQRTYTFLMDTHMLSLIEPSGSIGEPDRATARVAPTTDGVASDIYGTGDPGGRPET